MTFRTLSQAKLHAVACLAALLAAFLPSAHAQNLTLDTKGHYAAARPGGGFTFGVLSNAPVVVPQGAPLGAPPNTIVARGLGSISAVGGQPTFTTQGRAPLPAGRSLPVNLTTTISKPAAAAAIGRFATRVLPPLSIGIALHDLAKDLGFDVVNAPGGAPGVVVTKPDPLAGWCTSAPCYEYSNSSYPTGWRRSANEACEAILVIRNANAPNGQYRYNGVGPSGLTCLMDYRTTGNWGAANTSLQQRTRTPDSGAAPTTPSSVRELEDALAAQSGWPSSATRALADAINAGDVVTLHALPTVSGPAIVEGPSSTTNQQVKKPDGTPGVKQTTSTTIYNNTYNTNNVTTTATVTRTSITNYADGSTETDTETEDGEPDQEELPQDKPLGDVPELYEPKYPDGPAGVWDAKLAELKATPLFQLPSVFAPNLGDTGGCPNWTIPLNVGIASWGTHGTNIPCGVWAFLRICVLIGAAFLARALIFGG